MRRVMCVWCPRWPVQRLLSVQPELKGRPLILFAESRRNLLVTACSSEAMKSGIRVGMPLGEARSLLPSGSTRHQQQPTWELVVKRADPLMDRTRLKDLALHCQRYSPLVGLEETPAPESIWLDISGSEALFGGERGLVETLLADLAQQGIQARIAIADTWGTAWGVSHFDTLMVIPAGEQAAALAPLPVAALRISGTVIDSLLSLDVSTVGRLMKIPRASLPSRFGKELVRRLDQAIGLAPELLTAERLIEPFVTEWLFEEPVSDRQVLDHVCEALLDRVLVVINARRAALRELSCRWLGTATEPVTLRLLRPTTDRRHLLDLLRLQFERRVFASGVAGMRMEVVEISLPPVRQATLFGNEVEEKHQRLLGELVDRLSSRLGSQAVLRSRLQSDPLPELSCQYVPWLNGDGAMGDPDEVKGADPFVVIPSRLRCRPLRLLTLPRPLLVERCSFEGLPSRVERSSVVRVSGPERIESGWWRGTDMKRDYYRVDLASGASLWAFCDRTSGGWFLHGLFW